MSEFQVVALTVGAFLIVFPAFWSGVVWVISRFGWSRLAASYRTDAPRTGRTFRFESGRIGPAAYSSTLTVSLEPEGIRLAVMPLFRPGHPPILIPWGDVLDIRPHRVLWHTAYALDTAAPKPVTVHLSERVIQAIRDEGQETHP